MIGHIAYVLAFATIAPPVRRSPFVAVAMAAFGTSILAWRWRNLGEVRVRVIAYVTTIRTMVVAALGVYAKGGPSAPLVALGAGLFAVSDIAVACERFVSNVFANKAWGLPTYYTGQLMLAWAVGG